ncbi:hypothetical protein KAX02_09900 [candidate division WOR-3 bacterium]|nr:hypothetical protein [candidate division WOR-3 bacterium]
MPFLLVYFLIFTPVDSLYVVDTQDRWISEDKFEHIFVSAFLLGTTYYMSHYEFSCSERNASQIAVGVSLSIGICKELYDLTCRGNPSYKDIFADIIGVVIGVLIFTL